jgi:hypothetical protein
MRGRAQEYDHDAGETGPCQDEEGPRADHREVYEVKMKNEKCRVQNCLWFLFHFAFCNLHFDFFNGGFTS